MEECEQVAEKINLKVETIVESNSTEIVSTKVGEETSPLERHLSAANIKPLPGHFIDGASATQAMNRPLPLLGQALGLFTLVAAIAWLWSHHMLSISAGIAYFILPAILAIVFASVIIAAMKMQAKSWTELLAGAMHPLVFFDKKMFLPLSIGVLGDAHQGYNNYLLAAACYGEVVRSVHPLDVLSSHRGFERELIISLAYAGKFEKSLFYADNAVRYAEYLLSTVNTDATRNYFGLATRTAAMAYELAGNNEKANELREQCYEFAKDLPFTDETRLFGNIAKAEALCQTEEYDKALPLLSDFIENVSSGHKMSSDPVLRSKGYHLLAICHARLGDYETAREMYKLGLEKGGSDLSTYVAAEGVCADAQILRLSGQIEDADALIEKALKKLRVSGDTVLCRRLSALHSDPSKCSASLSTEHEHDEIHSQYDDEPKPVPILMDDHDFKNTLQRTFFGFLLLAVAVPILNHDALYLLWACPLFLGIAIYFMRCRSKQIDAAAAAIANGKPQLVKVKLCGSKDLSLYLDDGRALPYTALSLEQWGKLQSVAGDSLFEAVAYTNDAGEIAAVQVLGFYASVKRFHGNFF